MLSSSNLTLFPDQQSLAARFSQIKWLEGICPRQNIIATSLKLRAGQEVKIGLESMFY
jgi:hypothetical protein